LFKNIILKKKLPGVMFGVLPGVIKGVEIQRGLLYYHYLLVSSEL